MRKVLFVDDNEPLINSFKNYFDRIPKNWAPIYLTDPIKATDLLLFGDIDIIITDIHMPNMDGVKLLDFAKKEHPDVIRIAISGEQDTPDLLENAKNAHRYMQKPVDLNQLRELIERVATLSEIIPNSDTRKIVASLDVIPTTPRVYRELLSELNRDDGSLKRISQLVAEDPGLTAGLLKVVNSAFFNLPNEITSAQQAVTLLGLEIVKGILFSVEMMRTFSIEDEKVFSINDIVEHCLLVANFAKTILEHEHINKTVIEKTFVTAILHDIGELIFAYALPDRYQTIIEVSRSFDQTLARLEMQVLGSTHAEAGAYLLGLWGLPDDIVSAIANHHTPAKASGNAAAILATMHAADYICCKLFPEFRLGGEEHIEASFLKRLKIHHKLDEWEELCREKAYEIGYLEEEEVGS